MSPLCVCFSYGKIIYKRFYLSFTKCLQFLQVWNTNVVQCTKVTGRITFYPCFLRFWFLCQILKYLNNRKLSKIIHIMEQIMRLHYTHYIWEILKKERIEWTDLSSESFRYYITCSCIYKNLTLNWWKVLAHKGWDFHCGANLSSGLWCCVIMSGHK
jgi:hypothetical protein